jgi:hypothetical protein
MPGLLVKLEAAGEPQVTAAHCRGLDDQYVVLASDTSGNGRLDVVEQDERPRVSSGRPYVDLGLVQVLGPRPR